MSEIKKMKAKTKYQFRGDTVSNWETLNPILENREPGLVLDENGKTIGFKIGDGVTAWNDLEYHNIDGGGSGSSIDPAILQKKLELWQPNTEYKIGDVVVAETVLGNGMANVILTCIENHTSSASEDYMEFISKWTLTLINSYRAINDALGNDIVETYATKEELKTKIEPWQPNTAYKVGDMVVAKTYDNESDSIDTVIAICIEEHVSSDTRQLVIEQDGSNWSYNSLYAKYDSSGNIINNYYATKEELNNKFSMGLKRKFVDVLPDDATSEDQNTIYMVKRIDNPSNNIYDEYIAVEQGWYKTGYSSDNILLYIDTDSKPEEEPYEIYNANVINGEISVIIHADDGYFMAYKIKLQNKDKTIEVIEDGINGSDIALADLINSSSSNYDTYKINIIPIENSEWSLYTLENTDQGDLTYYGKYYKIEIYKNMSDADYDGPDFVFEKIGSTEINMDNYYTKDEINEQIGDIEAALDSIIVIQESLIGGDI